MDNSTARTILSLNEQRNKAVEERQRALLCQAEMEHELRILRHMKREITVCLLDRRLTGRKRDESKNYHHVIGKITRIIRNAQSAS